MNGIELDQIKFPSYRTRLNSSVYVNEKLQMERKSLCFGYMYIIIYIAQWIQILFFLFPYWIQVSNLPRCTSFVRTRLFENENK